MATKKTTKKPTTKKNTTKKNIKKPTGKNVDYYEIKLFLLLGFTVLSIFSLHTELIGIVGKIIKSVYLGLFSYAGFAIPYIVFLVFFYKLNNRLIIYRKKAIIGLLLLLISIIFIVNILNFDNLNTQYIEPKVSLLTFDAIADSYNDGIELLGSGVIGNLFGKLFVKLVGITGLYIVISTLWLISFILITNIKITELVKSFLSQSKENIKNNKEIKRKAKEKYIVEAEKLEESRLKEQEKIKKQREEELSSRSSEKMNKALEKVEKRLKVEEKHQQKSLEDFDAMFVQSPTKSIVDKILKKTTVPPKEVLQAKKVLTEQEKLALKEREEAFSKYDTKGYAFDENYNVDSIVDQSPDIFDNHLESTLSEEDLSIPITGFGAIVNESIKKAYNQSTDIVENIQENNVIESDIEIPEVVPKEKVKDTVIVKANKPVSKPKDGMSSFDAAFLKSEKEFASVKYDDDIFENRTPMSQEEKENANKFDEVINNNYEESKIPDAIIQKHMNERVRLEFENYRIPSIQILDENKTLNQDNKSEIYEKAKKLEEILTNFNIDAKVIQISKGPAITRYEIQLKPGTKLSKITNLSDDIALNLATQQVRIAAVPNKAAVGIEVPNKTTSLVRLREVLETEKFDKSSGKLSCGLGKNIAGTPIIADLAKMPHMLIAGATGSGKSVCVNTLITSILLNAKPDEVKFLMIDPKVVELNSYNGIPHLILPVVTDPKKASVALNWAVQEMTRRYNSFAEQGVRDIKGFNKKFGDDKELFMPQIVVIIDELADLMMVAPNQVEDAICRLAQMARAAGIHLIVATQRPSVDVITGVIKANIPSRIAFAVSSAIDSRTIIDMSGAEKLLGKGDMLYYPVGSSKPQRVQGAFISDEEVEAVVDAVKNQFDAFEYDENLLNNVNTSIQSESDESDDEHLSSAIRLVVEMEQASISMLQRKFKIGYNRAARLVDEMEERGIVGPAMGSKPRNVLVSKSELE